MVYTPLMQAMNEYAQAIRGDWSNFDGRTERDIIESWVDEMNNPDQAHDLQWWRDHLNICLNGDGHWQWYCDQYECDA